MAFDIAVKAQEMALEDEGTIVTILERNGEPAIDEAGNPVTWTVCGINSKQYRKAEAWQRKEFRKIRGREMTDAEHTTHQAEFIARCSLTNSGFTENGQPLPFSTANAALVLERLPYVRRQIEQAIGDPELFTRKALSS